MAGLAEIAQFRLGFFGASKRMGFLRNIINEFDIKANGLIRLNDPI